jgi:predicted HicB family RNase H-like nuclease
MKYKGFVGTVDFCDEDKIYHGKVIGIPNTYIGYHGDTLEALKKEFIDAIEFHLLPDEITNEEPNTEYAVA